MGSSPCWLAAFAATNCLNRIAEHPKSMSTQTIYQPEWVTFQRSTYSNTQMSKNFSLVFSISAHNPTNFCRLICRPPKEPTPPPPEPEKTELDLMLEKHAAADDTAAEASIAKSK